MKFTHDIKEYLFLSKRRFIHCLFFIFPFFDFQKAIAQNLGDLLDVISMYFSKISGPELITESIEKLGPILASFIIGENLNGWVEVFNAVFVYFHPPEIGFVLAKKCLNTQSVVYINIVYMQQDSTRLHKVTPAYNSFHESYDSNMVSILHCLSQTQFIYIHSTSNSSTRRVSIRNQNKHLSRVGNLSIFHF